MPYKSEYASKPYSGTPKKQSKSSSQNNPRQPNGLFPYSFVERSGGKAALTAQHHQLEADRWDVAFEVTWELLTPTALNPCNDASVLSAMPETDSQTSFAGYNKRWLMLQNRLAISPFTVKSAVANGFANLLGGCYRVMTREEGHKDLEEGNFPYNGAWKRYRVDMAASKAGILTRIEVHPDGSRHVTIQPIKEFLYDQEPDKPFDPRVHYRFTIAKDRGPHRPPILGSVVADQPEAGKRVFYHGSYRFGMNADLQAHALGKRHRHRFYQKKGNPVSGRLRKENFLGVNDLKNVVYAGQLKHGPHGRDSRPEGDPWYENLAALEPGDWVYYQDLGGQVSAIGRCFQFKALFLHEDAVPETNRQCHTTKELCPRCAMFGMTEGENPADDNTSSKSDAVGFKGRFKAAALLASEKLAPASPRTLSYGFFNGVSVSAAQWQDDQKRQRAWQSLLPIMAAPKPNKRDKKNGYYNPNGDIRGAKRYRFGKRDQAQSFEAETQGADYTHRLRNWAMICDKGMTFSGVLGAENCNRREVAALLLLLSHDLAQHGFKLGLGKALGMGNVVSQIRRVWVRNARDYTWQVLEVPNSDDALFRGLEAHLAGITKEVNTLKSKHKQIHKLNENAEKQLGYPGPSLDYWKNTGS